MAGICQIIGLKRNRSSNKNFRNPLRKEETVFIDVITEQPDLLVKHRLGRELR